MARPRGRRPKCTANPLAHAAVVTCLAASALIGAHARAWAQSGANVLVVVNQASQSSVRIGDYYASKRAVPAEQVVRLSVASSDEISRADFERHIQAPVARWIARHLAHDRILYILLTKGIPLRIQGTAGRSGTTASVDSELALLYRRMTGMPVSTVGPVPNPFFLGDRPLADARPFTHGAHDIYLVTRLDGFSDEDVIGLIDRALVPSPDGRFVLDGRAALDDPGNRWLEEAASRLSSAGLADRMTLDTTSRVLRDERDVLGYFSWGSTDPAVRDRSQGTVFLPGAIAGSFVGTDARTFTPPPESWIIGAWDQPRAFHAGSPESLTGDLVRGGVTGASGHVAEPYLDGSVRPQILFPAYAAGFNLAEAFYLSTPSLSWQAVVVGDPLCSPFRRRWPFPDVIDRGIDEVTELPALFAGRRLLSLADGAAGTRGLEAYVRAESRLARDDRAGAREAFEESVRLRPGFVPAHLQFASLLEESQQYDAAIAQYRLALAVAPNSVAALNNLAYALAVRKGQPGDALPLAERAYTLSQATPEVRGNVADTLGWIHHLVGNDREASRLLAESVALAPSSADAHLHLAVVKAAAGDIEAATRALDRAIELAPTVADREEAKRVRGLVKR